MLSYIAETPAHLLHPLHHLLALLRRVALLKLLVVILDAPQCAHQRPEQPPVALLQLRVLLLPDSSSEGSNQPVHHGICHRRVQIGRCQPGDVNKRFRRSPERPPLGSVASAKGLGDPQQQVMEPRQQVGEPRQRVGEPRQQATGRRLLVQG
eukprot:1194696-Prorocentrum_minimum.AAC.7